MLSYMLSEKVNLTIISRFRFNAIYLSLFIRLSDFPYWVSGYLACWNNNSISTTPTKNSYLLKSIHLFFYDHLLIFYHIFCLQILHSPERELVNGVRIALSDNSLLWPILGCDELKSCVLVITCWWKPQESAQPSPRSAAGTPSQTSARCSRCWWTWVLKSYCFKSLTHKCVN